MTTTIRGTMHPRFDEILTPEAVAFVAALDGAFAGRRAELLQARRDRARRISAGENLDFLPETKNIRNDPSWTVAAPGPGLTDRRCELVSPATRKMGVHAQRSGAQVWLADLEDATAPSWDNVISGQVNLHDAVRGRLDYTDEDGQTEHGQLNPPTIIMRPRAWHLCEKHIAIDGRPISASLVDFGLYFFHNAQALIDGGAGPYFYLPKIESHLEARLWNDVFVMAQDLLGIPQGTIRATVLIETLTAAFEMDEILYELRDHASGLNAGRWDYIFSYIRTFAQRGDEFVLPDRDKVTMTTPFMRAYTQLLVATCHKRGAHAIGGPAAVNPTRQDEESRHRALSQVRAEKEREAAEGFDGSWVAHPAVVETCLTAYATVLGDRTCQRDVRRIADISARDLVSLDGIQQQISLQGVRTNVTVALRYLASWVAGTGAVAIEHLMEDAATVEISRAQLWQWVHHRSQLAEGPQVTRQLVERVIDEEMTRLTRGQDESTVARFEAARDILTASALDDYLPGFFTNYGYVRYLTDRPLRMKGALTPDDLRQSEKVPADAHGNGSAA
ncbi:malate synthase A [Luteipulveratus halotolerans]|uniref:Malate synthase n=1 Tax=Luteipulveratus halotolerans TaxID=1631356 RepID=A0A0L6CIG5_9MICO|nr:malate synthase A [Luteipulveratus halotolerans]KNX37587.1 malate synthase [Luteipulveratus halotolerans]